MPWYLEMKIFAIFIGVKRGMKQRFGLLPLFAYHVDFGLLIVVSLSFLHYWIPFHLHQARNLQEDHSLSTVANMEIMISNAASSINP